MTETEINNLVTRQKEFFRAGNTLDPKTRRNYLKRLKEAIHVREEEILQALKNDLGKSATEGYMSEIGLTMDELDYQIKHLYSFAKKRKAHTPLAQFSAKSYRLPSPYGVTLVMSPWNYPFLLSAEPLIEAVAAGNTAILKPSAYAGASSEVLWKIVNEVFPPEYVSVIKGGREENHALIEADFDYIFFTGGKTVGRYVNESAAKRMIPVTLELGGKSPCIVDSSAKIGLAARRIVFGKYLNCGQTCVAPDYVLCAASVKDEFIGAVKDEIVRQFGAESFRNPDYGKIISEKHFQRLRRLLDENREKIVYGGQWDEDRLKIEPTVMDNVLFSDSVMQEEIFGPILPVLAFSSPDEAISLINAHDAPIALYVFSSERSTCEKILSHVSFGGGCINDTIVHLATHSMPFGGFRQSGIGAYHGRSGFDAFTHYKSIVDKKTFPDLPMRYQPYTKLHEKLIRFFLH